MKTILALVFFPIALAFVGTLGFMYVVGGVIVSIIIAIIGLKR